MTDFMPGQLVMLKNTYTDVHSVWCWTVPRDSSKSRGHRNGTVGLYLNSSSAEIEDVDDRSLRCSRRARHNVLIEDQIWSVLKIDLIAFPFEQGNTE